MRAPLADGSAGGAGRNARHGQEADLRAALLSVYYASLGSRFEVSGAPSVLLPPQIRIQPLEDALAVLNRESPSRFREAIWLLIRSTPLKGSPADPKERYPRELASYLDPAQLEALSTIRRTYRADSNLFAAALVACRDGNQPQFKGLASLIAKAAESETQSFADAVDAMFGASPAELLEDMRRGWERSQQQMAKIESTVGLDLYSFVEEFASAVAFTEWARDHVPGEWAAPTEAGALSVLPVSSVVTQSTASLLTTATVTTLVTGDFAHLAAATDPRSWAEQSDVIEYTRFVNSPFPDSDSDPDNLDQGSDPGPLGSGFPGLRLLEERAQMGWGEDDDQRSWFHNVLAVGHQVGSAGDPSREDIDVEFRLCRSIDSVVLWDRRHGGILVDEGFIKARSMGPGRWRVTSRKTLRFSDRTPYSGSHGWTDFGELVNYLAPAALTWWVESQTYSLGDRPYVEAVSQTAGGPASPVQSA